MTAEVHKFGGSLLKDASIIDQVARIIASLKRPSVVVVSAIFNITNLLEQVYNSLRFVNQENAQKILSQLMDIHIKIASQLNIPTGKIYELTSPILDLREDLSYARVVSVGEKLSSYILFKLLEARGIKEIEYVPAQSFMVTSSHQYGAMPNFKEIAKRFPKPYKEKIILTEGFIGIDKNGNPTTLGREGSDYTATIIASVLDSKQVTLWKNVDGIYNADPAEFKGALTFNNLNVNEAIEMTFFGARVLHPRTFTPLENKNAKLVIKSPFSEQHTVVSEEPTNPKLPIFILHKNVRLITCYLKQPDLMDATDYARIYQLSAKYKVPIKLLQKGARSLSIVVPEQLPTLSEFMNDLRQAYNIKFNSNLFLLTVRHLKQNISDFLKGKAILSEITRQTQHYLLTEWQPIDISVFY